MVPALGNILYGIRISESQWNQLVAYSDQLLMEIEWNLGLPTKPQIGIANDEQGINCDVRILSTCATGKAQAVPRRLNQTLYRCAPPSPTYDETNDEK